MLNATGLPLQDLVFGASVYFPPFFKAFAFVFVIWLVVHLLAMLISVELILNSVDINFVVFNRFLFPEQLEGFFFTLFAIGISAAETAVAIAIIINIYRNLRNIGVKSLREMKW